MARADFDPTPVRTPPSCDVCNAPLSGRPYVDGRLAHPAGVWGFFCLDCHELFGVGLGTGRGQVFDASGLKVSRLEDLRAEQGRNRR